MAFVSRHFTEPMDYSDYVEAGKPYGKTGYVRWLREKYEARINQDHEKLETARKALEGFLKRSLSSEPHIYPSEFAEALAQISEKGGQ